MATNLKLVMASCSPRRRELIQALDLQIIITEPNLVENMYGTGENPHDLVLRLSMEKVNSVQDDISGAIVLGADTVVVLGNNVIGKPSDVSDAMNMLHHLKGRTHLVMTGITALDLKSNKYRSTVTTTKVFMRNYTTKEMELYANSKLPLDKAGGYGIQDTPFNPAEAIEGCYFNVVGLPICEVINLLKLFRLDVHLRHGWEFSEKCHGCHLGQLLKDGPS